MKRNEREACCSCRQPFVPPCRKAQNTTRVCRGENIKVLEEEANRGCWRGKNNGLQYSASLSLKWKRRKNGRILVQTQKNPSDLNVLILLKVCVCVDGVHEGGAARKAGEAPGHVCRKLRGITEGDFQGWLRNKNKNEKGRFFFSDQSLVKVKMKSRRVRRRTLIGSGRGLGGCVVLQRGRPGRSIKLR